MKGKVGNKKRDVEDNEVNETNEDNSSEKELNHETAPVEKRGRPRKETCDVKVKG